MKIRDACPDDLPELPAIELAAGRVFADIGMAEIADAVPPSLDRLAGYQADGRAWVTVDAADRPVAYLIADVVDGNAHIEQVSVHPSAAGHRLGAALIDHTGAWATRHGLPALTLTTFRNVPWNAPYYERCGFHALHDADLPPGLRAIRRQEAAHGLDAWPRIAMRRPVRLR